MIKKNMMGIGIQKSSDHAFLFLFVFSRKIVFKTQMSISVSHSICMAQIYLDLFFILLAQ